MDLSFTPEQEQFRLRMRRWLDENLPPGRGTEALPRSVQLVAPDVRAVDHGRFQQSFLFSRASSIAGGTSEVQLNIIATRLLGLPKGS
jgi:hypothetical protein